MRWFTRSKQQNTAVSAVPDIEANQRNKSDRKRKASITIFEMALFAMFGALMFLSKMMMEFLPNVHLLGMFTMIFAVVYRAKGLIPIYIFVMINGVVAGFAPWWVPYLYVWMVLWGITMLLPRNMKKTASIIVYPVVCALHGFLFGVLYAPAQALMFNLDFRGTIAWIISGLPFDIAHGISNFVAGFLVYPLSQLLIKLSSKASLMKSS